MTDRRGRLRAPILLLLSCLGIVLATTTANPATNAAANLPAPGNAGAAAAPAVPVVEHTAPAKADQPAKAGARKKAEAPTSFYAPSPCNRPTAKAATGVRAVSCQSVLKADSDLKPLTSAAGPLPGSLGPVDIQDAYNLPAEPPAGNEHAVVAIVDALGASNAEADLAVYRAQYGLPSCTTANGCFRKVDQNGGANYPPDDPGWALETALDLDAVSAACPGCRLLLVEANSTSPYDIVVAVDTAVRMGARYVSNSYGIDGEDPEQDTLDSHYDVPGVVMVASSGDHGHGLQNWPSTNPHVVSAGGTNLFRDPANQRGWSEEAWTSAGSGCSLYEPKPAYQDGLATNCANRAAADISAVGDPASGFAVYDTTQSGGWTQVGGTSLSSPLIAAMYALAGTPKPGTEPVTYPYFNRGNDLFDVTTGSNGTCGNVLCVAGDGWDGPTGLGSPNGVGTLAYTPQGTVSGHVRDAEGNPVGGATVTLAGAAKYTVATDADGAYRIAVAAGDYDLTASRFGYAAATGTVSVADEQARTLDLAITKLATSTVSGTVTDGSGHGWPLYARVTIDGYPGGAVFTDPFTGRYTVDLPRGANYRLHVAAVGPGYRDTDLSVDVAEAAVREDAKMAVDTEACAAPGYGHAALAGFDGWHGTATEDGWTITDAAGPGWSFDDGTEFYNLAGTGSYALASPITRDGAAEDTVLASPSLDLTGDASPTLSFGAIFVPDAGTSFDADVSTDGGATWTTVWHEDAAVVQERVSVPMPQAAGKPDVRVRFHFTGAGGSIAEVDDVAIGACVAHDGGLVAGIVRDANTGQSVNDATVTDPSVPGATAVSMPTPEDPALPDGFYTLFDTPGGHSYTASAPRYRSPAITATTAVNSVVRENIGLLAGELTVTADALSASRPMGGSAAKAVTLANTGTAPLHVALGEHTTGFTPAATGWQPMPNVVEFVHDNAVAGYQGKVYSVGGIPSNGLAPIERGYVHDPATGKWTPIAPMPAPLMEGAAAFVNGTMYVTGGFSDTGEVGALFAYRPATDSWVTLAPMPVPAFGATVTVLGGKLYVVGGCASRCTVDAVASAFTYDPATNVWTRLADYPEKASFAACAGVAGEVVCAGGLSGEGIPMGRAYAYRPSANTWTRVADLPYSVAEMIYSGANGRLQIAGGRVVGETAHAVEYDPVADRWTSLPDAPQGFYGAGRGSCGLYQVGSLVPALRTTSWLPGYDQCGDDDAAWLKPSRASVDLAPGASVSVTVTLDAAAIAQPGAYTARLSFETDAPYPTEPLSASFTVTAPKTWGEIEGTVTDAATGAPLRSATVQVCTMYHNGTCGQVAYTLRTDAQGHYELWLDKGYNPLFLTVAQNGYQPQFRQVKVRAATTTVTDFPLRKI